MELNKAIEWIVDMRSANMEHTLATQVGIVLYNQMKELEKKAQFLMQTIRQREINLNVTEQRNRELEAQRDELPLRAILDWMMCSDPWPGGDEQAIKKWLDKISISKGYDNWITAFHKLEKEQ